jgi:hypothetical protein
MPRWLPLTLTLGWAAFAAYWLWRLITEPAPDFLDWLQPFIACANIVLWAFMSWRASHPKPVSVPRTPGEEAD